MRYRTYWEFQCSPEFFGEISKFRFFASAPEPFYENQRYQELYQESPMVAFERFCSYLTQDILHDACDAARLLYGPNIAHYLNLGYNPDETCFALNWCNDKDGPMCRLFPPYNEDNIVKEESMIADAEL